jgi:hypothetical protein
VILTWWLGEILGEAGKRRPHLRQFCIAQAAANAPVVLRRSAPEPMKCRHTGRGQARHLHPTIVWEPLSQNEPVFGHRIEVMG